MQHLIDLQIESILIGIIADGFNRSLDALEKVGAIETTQLSKQYKGMGSKYYDLVTEQMELTAKYGAQHLRHLLSDADGAARSAGRTDEAK